MRVCDKNNLIANKNNHVFGDGTLAANDVASSMGVHWGIFKDIQLGLAGHPSVGGVDSIRPDKREDATIAPGQTPIRQLASLPSATRFPASRVQEEPESLA